MIRGTKREKPTSSWLKCGQCGHTFRRKSIRQYKCAACGAHFTKQVDPPSKPCTCFSCRYREGERNA